MKNGKNLVEGIELQYTHFIRTLREKENYKHLGILKVDTTKQAEMKVKIRKEYFGRTEIFLKASSAAEISEELRQMNQRTRKLTTIHKALYLRDNRYYIAHEKKDEEDLQALRT